MTRIVILYIIFGILYCYRKIQYEVGNQVVLPPSTGHILENTSNLPRNLEVNVQFSKPFSVQPQVFLSQTLLDIDRNNPLGFIQEVRQVTTTGFRIRVNAVSQYALHGLTVDWYAFDDPRIQVLTFESSNLFELSTNFGERKIYFQIPHDLKQASKGLVSSIGVIHKFDEQKVELNIEQITSRIVNVSVRTDHYSQIDYIKFNILLGTDQSLWTSPAQALIIDPASNTISFPQEWQNNISVPMFMMRGYHNPKFENIRLRYKNQRFQSNQLVASVGGGILQYMHFITKVEYIILIQTTQYLDPNCAELFSECNFKGDSIIICHRIPDLTGYFKPFKSLSIPLCRKLYLFDQVNYQGNKISIVENQNCISLNDKLSAKFQGIISLIKIYFFDTNLNPLCSNATFYSGCNYQGTQYIVKRGEHLKLSNQIPFQINSIKLCPNMVVRLRDSKFLNGVTQEYTTSQACLNNFQFPKYRSTD